MSYFFNKFYRMGARQVQVSPPNPPPVFVDDCAPAGKASTWENKKKTADTEQLQETSRSVASARVRLHAKRFETMKNDKHWFTYNDIPRRFRASDYTGAAKKIFG